MCLIDTTWTVANQGYFCRLLSLHWNSWALLFNEPDVVFMFMSACFFAKCCQTILPQEEGRQLLRYCRSPSFGKTIHLQGKHSVDSFSQIWTFTSTDEQFMQINDKKIHVVKCQAINLKSYFLLPFDWLPVDAKESLVLTNQAMHLWCL